MILFEALEKLINEHGSAAILREHVVLIKAQHAALEKQHADLQAKHQILEAEAQQLRAQAGMLAKKLQSGHFCSHCGSHELDRIGNRPDPVFGELGGLQDLFSCRACGQQSVFART